jgi:hypothetical protein
MFGMILSFDGEPAGARRRARIASPARLTGEMRYDAVRNPGPRRRPEAGNPETWGSCPMR